MFFWIVSGTKNDDRKRYSRLRAHPNNFAAKRESSTTSFHSSHSSNNKRSNLNSNCSSGNNNNSGGCSSSNSSSGVSSMSNSSSYDSNGNQRSWKYTLDDSDSEFEDNASQHRVSTSAEESSDFGE